MATEHQLEELTIEITQKCPMHCLLCSSNGGNENPDELHYQDLLTLVDDAKKIGLKCVSISGGEPFEYPRLFDFLRYLKDQNLEVSLYTCGNIEVGNGLTPLDTEQLTKVRDLSIDNLIFSIHGPDSELHDRITKREGSFDNLKQAIDTAKLLGLEFEFHFVPTRLNYQYLQEVADFAFTSGAKRMSILRFVPQGRGKENREMLEMSPSDIELFKSILKSVISNSKIDIRLGSPFNCLHIRSGKQCSAGLDKAIVRPDGFVFPCVAMKRILREDADINLHDHALFDIWQKSDIFRKVRESHDGLLNSDCGHCPHFTSCFGGCLTQKLILDINEGKRRDPLCESIPFDESARNTPCTGMDEE